jgi:hypothetical protein
MLFNKLTTFGMNVSQLLQEQIKARRDLKIKLLLFPSVERSTFHRHHDTQQDDAQDNDIIHNNIRGCIFGRV